MTPTAPTAKKILTKARALLSDEEHWTIGELFETVPVDQEQPTACLIGALYYGAGLCKVEPDQYDPALLKRWQPTSTVLEDYTLYTSERYDDVIASYEPAQQELVKAARTLFGCIKALEDVTGSDDDLYFSSIPDFNDDWATHETVLQVLDCAITKEATNV